MKRFNAQRVGKFILMGVVFIALAGFLVMTLWNNVLTQAVHVSTINFGQALGIFFLSKILFGGFRGGGPPWGNRMRQKWQTMSPEEREQFQQQWKNRCCGWRKPASAEVATESKNPA